jgi:glycosyltransferase involved in cell wall biosynthesis
VTGLTVSVVIPTYNRAQLLARALRSVLPECQPGDEVIVVDDGSSDDTEAVVRAFGPPVRYLAGVHRGAGAARNMGIRAASGDLVAFLDDDDEWMPGKLAWQRTILQQFPDVLFLFSDFGSKRDWSNEVSHHVLSTWRREPGYEKRRWEAILGPGVASASIAGMPSSAPPFTLHVGRLYEALIHGWYVCMITLIARRTEAGDALRFPEDLPTFENEEFFARLAQRGVAAYMDCETAWQHRHSGGRLSNDDVATRADTAVKIIKRVWGTDEEYLRLHRDEFEAAIDSHRAQKVRYLLGRGRRQEAIQELDRMSHRPLSYSLLAHLPSALVGLAAAVRRHRHPGRRR